MATRIATENAQLLAADSLAWDAIWKTFNVPYDSLPTEYNKNALTGDRTGFSRNANKTTWTTGNVTTCEVPKSAAPELWVDGKPAILMIAVALIPDTNDVLITSKMELSEHTSDFPQQKRIYADVEWGAEGKRMRLSDYHTLYVDRSGQDRIPWEVQ